MRSDRRLFARQRGLTLLGLLFWATIMGLSVLLAMRVIPTLNEFFNVQRAVDGAAAEGGATVGDVRAAFDRRKASEPSIKSISGKDLEVTKENDKIVINFSYDREIEIVKPVYLLIRYEGHSK